MSTPDRMRHSVVVRMDVLFLSIVDPASAYMEAQGPRRRRGRTFRGRAVFGPGVEGGARQAGPEELAEIRARHDADDAQDERRHDPLEVDSDALRQAVRELILHGKTEWRGGSVTLTARLVTFWHGDAVLDVRVTSPGMATTGLARVPRQRSAADDEVFAEYIRNALITI